MFRSIRATLPGALALLASAALARADQPMTFKLLGGPLYGVLAEGEITANTPAAFSSFIQKNIALPKVVQLNSGGGNLAAGLALGRAIRSAGWGTGVGTPGISSLSLNPGECDSACTFAFLGGVTRSLNPGSRFGVHRFWGLTQGDIQQSTQQLAGELVAYIREMGVNTEMYTLMTQGAPEQVKYLDPATMARLRITTGEIVEARILEERGLSLLRLTGADGGMEFGRLDFFCNGPGFLARAYFVSPPFPFEVSQYQLDWIIDPGARVTVPQENYRYAGVSGGKIVLEVQVPPKLLSDRILSARSIKMEITRRRARPQDVQLTDVQDDWIGIGAPIPNNFRTLAQTIGNSCH